MIIKAILPHFTDKKVESQRVDVICSRPRIQEVLGFKSQDLLTSEPSLVSPTPVSCPSLPLHYPWAPRPFCPGSWSLASVHRNHWRPAPLCFLGQAVRRVASDGCAVWMVLPQAPSGTQDGNPACALSLASSTVRSLQEELPEHIRLRPGRGSWGPTQGHMARLQ